MIRTHAALFALFLFIAPSAAVRPDVVLVTLDTTRADRMGFLGSSRGLTPSLDALARDSVVFTRAYAQAPITTVSHATILTGTFPPFHRVFDFGAPLSASLPYLPDLLRRNGYRTGAFVGSLILDPRNGTTPGFDRGFDVYDAPFRARRPGEDRYSTSERRGDAVLAHALTWLHDGDARPFFLWVHFFDPHEPYDPPPPFRERFGAAPYDGEIAWVDHLVGRLISALRATGRFDRSMVVVASDHGEALGDHGEDTHGLFLYDETIRVPLLVRLPGSRGAGSRVAARVRLADVAPTVLAVAGVATPPSVQGESLLSYVDTTPEQARTDPQRAERVVYSETDYPRRAFGWAPLASLRADRFLYVRAPRRELYDEAADAAAARNLAGARPGIADAMGRDLEAFIRRMSASAPAASSARADPELTSRLAALGYITGASDAAAPRGADPKDGVAVANELHAAVAAAEDGKFGIAVPLLERVVAMRPSIAYAQLQLGLAREHQGQHARAIPPLQKAVELQPNNAFARYVLGVARYETGDLAGAAAQFEVVTAEMPAWPDAHYSLAAVYARTDRVPRAMAELGAALRTAPKHFRANLLIGRLLIGSGQAAGAVAPLRAAIEVEPSSVDAHESLAEAYDRTGDRAGAARERRVATDLKAKR